MKKFLIFIFVFNELINSVNAQGIHIEFQSGFATFDMSALKKINNSLVKYIPLETRIVSSFPPYWYFQPSVILKSDKIGMGIFYNFQSTGSRISSADYSGEYRLDMKIHAHSPGIYVDCYLIPVYKFKLLAYSQIGFLYSNLRIDESIIIKDTTLMNYSYQFDCTNYLFEPGVKFDYKANSLGCEINFGYLFQFGDESFTTNTEESENPNVTLDRSIKPDWSGFRLGVSVYYFFKTKPKDDNSSHTK
jgi:hypothetical protein